MKKESIRIRHAGGATTVEVIASGSSYLDVARLIELAVPSMTPSLQVWKSGYPPRTVSSRNATDVFPLMEMKMIHVSLAVPGDTPTIDFTTTAARTAPMDEPAYTDPDGTVVRRVMDADNSCLFNSMGYVLLDHSTKDAIKLRQMVAQAVRDDPITFTGAFLGKPSPQDYIDFITDPKAWGGQIELLVFSRLFHTEIAAFDIIRNHVDIYGQGENYKRRVFCIYDGIHYDALAFTFDESLPKEVDVTQFSPRDDAAMEKAQAVCAEQHQKKAFTDTSNFTLRCLVCQVGLKGADEAQEHAREKGHTNFAEFR